MKKGILSVIFLMVLSINVQGQNLTEELASLFSFSMDMLDNNSDGGWNTPEEVKKMIPRAYNGKFIEKDGSLYRFKIDSLLSVPIIISYMFEDSMIKGIAISCKSEDNFLPCMYQIEEAMKKSDHVEYYGQRFRLVDADEGNGFMIRKSEGTRKSGRKITRIYTAIPRMGTIAVLFSNQ